MKRRDLLKLALAGPGMLAAAAAARAEQGCPTDGTPAQFIPKMPPDPRPAENDLDKYPKCPYCGMDRRQYHHARHLIHYSDDLADGLCSLHCAAISLALNIDRDPKAIYAADYGASADPKPLVEVDKTVYLIGGSLKGVMTKRPKFAFADRAAAEAARAKHGGELGDFQAALTASYLDMSEDVKMIRRNRAERRRRMLERQEPKG
jgi:nitrous oxide reductase accessory protein NosL